MEKAGAYLCLATAVASSLVGIFDQRDGNPVIATRLITRVARKELLNLLASVSSLASRFPNVSFLQVSLDELGR